MNDARNDAIVIRGVPDVAIDTSAETRKVERKLDTLVHLVTQLAVNQKPASVARVCHHSSRGQTLDREDDFQLLAVSVQEMMPLSLEEFTTWLQILLLKLESCDRSLPLLQESVASVLPMITIQMSVLLRSNLEGMRILRLMLQTSIAGNHRSRGQTLDREDGFELLEVSVQEMMPLNDAIIIRGVHDVATDTSAEATKVEDKLDTLVNLVTQLSSRRGYVYTSTETRKVEGKLDALVKLVTQLARIRSLPLLQESMASILSITTIQIARNDAIVIRGVHDVSTDTSTETKKVEGKLDALVNLVIQLAVNQKSASVARVCGIRSSNDQHTNFLTPSSFSARNDAILIRGVNDVATDTSTETRKVEGKLDALVNMVTQLAVNQKSASAARVFGIRSSNDHHTNVCPSSFSTRNDVIVIRGVHDVATDTSTETRKVERKLDALVNFSARNDAIVIRGVNDVAIDTSTETRKVEGKLDALVNLVTQLGVNQKPDSIARVCGIRSSNDHHTNRKSVLTPSSFSARNDAIVTRGVHDEAIDRSAETRNVEGKLDALINLVTQLAVNQKPASVARVCGIRSSNDHHTKVYPSSQKPRVNEHPEAYAANNYSRQPQQQRPDT
ncbi:hypothetical protein Fmac_024842 [Flemingia macrophylla]|uniref:Uncharacterized protein n=1 Tax=Flemingia macrophylla TaxID=520843 RepID=A0ABD1LQJ2_9FABA